jgi:hypothetical protein
MNKHLEKEEIINQFEFLEQYCKNDYSLHNGKTGLCLAYYLAGTLFTNENFTAKGKELLNEIGENIDKIQGFNFENGLAGIGWAIEWLIQQGFLIANSDDVLEDMDDELYKTVVCAKSQNLSLKDGTIGKGLYFYKRLTACNLSTLRYRNLCNQECLILLIDELHDILLTPEKEIPYNIIVNSSARIYELAESLLFLSKVNAQKVNKEILTNIICAIWKFVNKYFLSEEFKNNEFYNSNLYLIYACYKTGVYLKDAGFEKLARNTYVSYLTRVDSITDFSVYSEFIIKKLLKLTSTPQFLTKNRSDVHSEISIFGLLKSLTIFPKSEKFNWEEGWGL